MFSLFQIKPALINIFPLVELILIVKALAGALVTVPFNSFNQGALEGTNLPMFLCTLWL